MKGIILAGGKGTRLYPITESVNKQLLPIYDKPMIYYSLSTLMLAGIRDILITSTYEGVAGIRNLLGTGAKFGVNFTYEVQSEPRGIAEAFIIGEDFLANDSCCLVLGDNLFYGDGMKRRLKTAAKQAEAGKATIFGYYVNDPKRFGVVEFNEDKKVISIEEKPAEPKSNYAVTGLYFYPEGVASKAKQVKPSSRNELEITDLNKIYLEEDNLNVELLGRGFTWLDTGTVDSLLDASQFVQLIQSRQGIVISCPEEIAYKQNWLAKEQVLAQAQKMNSTAYGQHLFSVINDKIKY